jgi:hypothetical protein
MRPLAIYSGDEFPTVTVKYARKFPFGTPEPHKIHFVGMPLCAATKRHYGETRFYS